jgi:hypothetical protein
MICPWWGMVDQTQHVAIMCIILMEVRGCYHVHQFVCGAFVRDADAKKKCDVLHNIMHDFLHLRLILKEVDGAHCLTNAKIR